MRETAKCLQNLVYHSEYFKVTIKEGVATFKPYVKELEAVHIRIDYPHPAIWRKKKYCHILRQETCSRLDEWIFRHNRKIIFGLQQKLFDHAKSL